MTPLVKAAIVAGSAVSAYSAIQQGKYAKAAAQQEADQYEQEKRLAKLKAIEDANDRNQEMIIAEASNKALWAAKTGTDPSESASFLALRDVNEEMARKDLGAIRLMGAAASRKYDLAAWNSRLEAKTSMRSAYGKAATSLLSGYAKANV